ncbi:origin of replication complex subunit 3 [Olea europaea subsp. europaea]|uniref:Origin of replication complex subunit 3 n=1 Tax=Olea europaea subsp. europaea TaxID=158383 RepID=A0A8S0TA32_OLEEU|nr:origin of replication complex subunit 3 [Olea europaea subsp. europaea]
MAQAARSVTSPPTAAAENNLQPFFVLHKAAPPRKPTGKTRRRIDLSPQKADATVQVLDDNFRFESFNLLWCKIDCTMRNVLREINACVFEEIDRWVRESFDAIRACGVPNLARATRPHPIFNRAETAASRQLFTAILLTKNVEFVDDVLTFVDLGVHLRSSGCHVAQLTSLDFSAKNGVGGCLKTLLRQFLTVGIDAPDISILASWYTEQGNYESPLVVIIDDVQRCCGSVLSDFIIMLREWVIKIPIILIVGVATLDALRNTLASNALQGLFPRGFTLGTPAERMDAIVEAVLLKHYHGFSIGKQVTTFLRNFFLRHDGTLTSFIRALKIVMVQHLLVEPISFALVGLINEEDTKSFGGENTLLRETMVKRCLDLPSYQSRSSRSNRNGDIWDCGLSELKRFRKLWVCMAMCLYEVGKNYKITLLDLYCEMLEPELLNSGTSCHFELEKDDPSLFGGLQKGGFVNQIIQIVRGLPAVELCELLKSWETLTRSITKINEKVKELQSLTTFDENCPRRDLTETSKRHTAKSNVNGKRDGTTINEKVATFVDCTIRRYMQPIESIPFNEIVFFDNVDKLRTALIGDPRRRIQADLLESHKFLKCSCCSKNGSMPSPSMHDTSILYTLTQEHGDLINLHDWFQSFKSIISHPGSKAKQRLRLSPSPKKRKGSIEPRNRSDASIQAEFCRAITELQITGLIRMPSKRRPDYLQRVAFGL